MLTDDGTLVLEATKSEIALLVSKIGLSDSVKDQSLEYIKQLMDKNGTFPFLPLFMIILFSIMYDDDDYYH